MARKEILGINAPAISNGSNRENLENDQVKGIWGVAGIGTPVSRDKSSIKHEKPSFLREVLLNTPGIVKTDPNLLEIQREDAQRRAQAKTIKRAVKAKKQEFNQEIKRDNQAFKRKTLWALFELVIGAATGNPVATAGGVAEAAGAAADAAKTAQKKRSIKKNVKNMSEDIIEGEFRVLDDGKPKQLSSSKKS